MSKKPRDRDQKSTTPADWQSLRTHQKDVCWEETKDVCWEERKAGKAGWA